MAGRDASPLDVTGRVRPALAGFEPYDPAFTPCRINLSANENTHPLPASVTEAMCAAAVSCALNRYPDPMANDLRDLLAAWHGVERGNVMVGNGGDELLFNFIYAFGGPGRTLLDCPPSFSEYAFFASLAQTEVRQVWRDPETFELDQQAVLDAAPDCDIVIVTSPNNPTGNLVPFEFVGRLCAACPGLVMVDEAYMEFADAGASARSLLDAHDNLIILHTLSKAFGEAGIRLGYVLAAPDIIDVFGAVRQIYSVNVLTQAAALAAVRDRALFLPVIDRVRAERERMFSALAEIAGGALTVWPSQANFLLVRMPGASEVRQRLRDEFSILVRDFSHAPGLQDCLRITIGTPEENDAVLAALRALLAS